MCILYNQWDETYTVFFIIISALHVSGGFLLSTAGVDGLELSSKPATPALDSRKAWQYPRLHIQFYKLLLTGEKTARNM
jgi:hypothetical protein